MEEKACKNCLYWDKDDWDEKSHPAFTGYGICLYENSAFSPENKEPLMFVEEAGPALNTREDFVCKAWEWNGK